MARPAKTFKPEKARSIVISLSGKLLDYDFVHKNLVRHEPELLHLQGKPSAKAALEPLYEVAKYRSLVPFEDKHCAQLKDWVSTYMTEEGWVRFLAARRQQSRKHSSDVPRALSTTRMARYSLAKMAEEAGTTRVKFVDALVDWLEYDTEGERALAAFKKHLAKTLPAKPVKEAA